MQPIRPLGVAVALATLVLCPFPAMADDWPQWRGPTRDGVWREGNLVERFASPQLTPLWRAAVGSGYSGPTVAGGRVYVTDRLVEPKQVERVHCFEAGTGKPLWSHTYDCAYRDVGYEAGPRASVIVRDGRAYALGTMGNLFCFDAADGRVQWQKDLAAEYAVAMPEWGLSASPLIEGELLICQVGGKDACIVAFDRQTGKETWRALSDRPSYAAPIVIEQAGQRVLVCYTGDNVVGLNPRTGTVHWTHPFPPTRVVIGVSSPVFDGRGLFLTNFFDGALMLEVARDELAVKQRWKRAGPSEKETEALHSIISTPLLRDDHVYGVDSYGELRCLNAADGARVWESDRAVPRERWATIHFVQNGDRTWMFNDRGDLIIARLSPRGYEEISRTHIIDPTTEQLRRGDGVCWAHPAFADRKVFVRNDRELVCVSVAAE